MKPKLKLLAALVVLGQTALAAAGPVVIDIGDPNRSKYKIASPAPVEGSATLGKELSEGVRKDLDLSGWFITIDPKAFLADLKAEGTSINVDSWRAVGAQGVSKIRIVTAGDTATLSGFLYEVASGTQAVLSKSYTGKLSDVRMLAHAWANEIVLYYTREASFFGSRITFSAGGKGKRDIYVMDFDGARVGRITSNGSMNILPAFSPSGGQIALTSYWRGNPDLYVVGAGGGRMKRIASYSGLNSGAAWSPDGSKIALTLTKDGNADIYVISASDGSVVSRLTKDSAIDTSPSWSPDGSKVAFVSNRQGGPQIFVVGAGGGSATRVSWQGSYNTTPSWSPRGDESKLAWTGQSDGGNFDIFVYDFKNKQTLKLTQGQGSNEEPTWAPNGRALAFTSSRKSGTGIYVQAADGKGEAILVYKGGAYTPDWGPAPKKLP